MDEQYKHQTSQMIKGYEDIIKQLKDKIEELEAYNKELENKLMDA